MKAFPDEEACIAYLERIRWRGTVVSPFDASSKVYKCAGHRYKCKNTNKYFNVKTGTVFEDTKIPLVKWFMAIYLFSAHKKGISSHQLARDIGVTQKSAWFLLHRLRYAAALPNSPLAGTVEIDETYVGGKKSNQHAKKKRAGSRGRGTVDKKPVVGVLQRGGPVVAVVMDGVKSADLLPLIGSVVELGSTIMTDEYRGYHHVAEVYEHHIVRHSANQYVNGLAHTNSLEGFWSHFKRMLDGIYHHVSFEHLQRYVHEFTLRWNTRRLATAERFEVLLGNIAGRLTYERLIAHVQEAPSYSAHAR